MITMGAEMNLASAVGKSVEAIRNGSPMTLVKGAIAGGVLFTLANTAGCGGGGGNDSGSQGGINDTPSTSNYTFRGVSNISVVKASDLESAISLVEQGGDVCYVSPGNGDGVTTLSPGNADILDDGICKGKSGHDYTVLTLSPSVGGKLVIKSDFLRTPTDNGLNFSEWEQVALIKYMYANNVPVKLIQNGNKSIMAFDTDGNGSITEEDFKQFVTKLQNVEADLRSMIDGDNLASADTMTQNMISTALGTLKINNVSVQETVCSTDDAEPQTKHVIQGQVDLPHYIDVVGLNGASLSAEKIIAQYLELFLNGTEIQDNAIEVDYNPDTGRAVFKVAFPEGTNTVSMISKLQLSPQSVVDSRDLTVYKRKEVQADVSVPSDPSIINEEDHLLLEPGMSAYGVEIDLSGTGINRINPDDIRVITTGAGTFENTITADLVAFNNGIASLNIENVNAENGGYVVVIFQITVNGQVEEVEVVLPVGEKIGEEVSIDDALRGKNAEYIVIAGDSNGGGSGKNVDGSQINNRESLVRDARTGKYYHTSTNGRGSLLEQIAGTDSGQSTTVLAENHLPGSTLGDWKKKAGYKEGPNCDGLFDDGYLYAKFVEASVEFGQRNGGVTKSAFSTGSNDARTEAGTQSYEANLRTFLDNYLDDLSANSVIPQLTLVGPSMGYIAGVEDDGRANRLTQIAIILQRVAAEHSWVTMTQVNNLGNDDVHPNQAEFADVAMEILSSSSAARAIIDNTVGY